MKKLGCLLAIISCIGIINSKPTLSQEIIPGKGGSLTIVNQEGKRFVIEGGRLSRDGKNLFHTFQEFGLKPEQIATFLSNPKILNILTRVNGGNPSIINGLIEVVGGNSNLYLMNPAGIIFGPKARLNVPADFTATTSRSILFENGVFSAVGTNNYEQLTGEIKGFQFEGGQNGVIINAGDLQVKKEQNLSLTAGTVINTGSLEAPDGEIIVTAVPGSNRVRISQQGQILSLEIEVPVDSNGNPLPIQGKDLPKLLTGTAKEGIDTGLTVTDNNQVVLTNSKVAVNTGDVVANKISAENAILSANKNLILVESQLTTTGNLTLLAKDQVYVRDSLNKPFLARVGGELYIEGQQSIDILALSNPKTEIISGNNLSLVSDGIISSDAKFATGGNFSVLTLSAQPGNFVSLYDPIISSAEDVTFGDYTGASLKVESQGNITAGNIFITQPDQNVPSTDPDANTLQNNRALILRAGKTTTTQVKPENLDETTIDYSNTTSSEGKITVESINAVVPRNSFEQFSKPGLVILEAKGDISVTGAIPAIENPPIAIGTFVTKGVAENGGNVTIASDQGSVSITSGEINTTTNDGNAGNITITAKNNIQVGNLEAVTRNGTSGNVTLTGDSIQAGKLSSSNLGGGNAGNINITAQNDISLEQIDTLVRTRGQTQEFNGGNVTVTSNQGNVSLTTEGDTTTGGIRSFTPRGESGDLKIEAKNNIDVDYLDANLFRDGQGNGGDIAVTSTEGKVTVNEYIDSSTAANSTGGNTAIAAQGDISMGKIDLIVGTNGQGGNHNLTSTSGNITFSGDISSTIPNSNSQGNIGHVTITAQNGSVTTQNVNLSSQQGTGGSLTINAPNSSITTRNIDTQGKPAGNVTLSGKDIIKVDTINAEGGNAQINITTQQFFQGINTFTAINGQQATISTLGGQGDRITITHGGNQNNPFTIGEGFPNNGTVGGIFSSQTSRTLESLPFTSRERNSEIISSNGTNPTQEESLLNSVIVGPSLTQDSSSVATRSSGLTTTILNTQQIRQILSKIQLITGQKPALIYVRFTPPGINPSASEIDINRLESELTSQYQSFLGLDKKPTDLTLSVPPGDKDYLDLLILTSDGEPLRIPVKEVTREQFLKLAQEFSNQISDPNQLEDDSYLLKAQQLYQWLIAPLEATLKQENIDNLLFIMPVGLRLLPVAALHDGQQFLVEKYSSGFAPSLSLNNNNYISLKDQKLLAMGASEFEDKQAEGPLDAVKAELQIITKIWQENDNYFLNQEFTPNELITARQATPYGIVHLATHADFTPGDLSQSYIQFYYNRIGLNDVREFNFNSPSTELLVLSACNTAFGDKDVELGFAGFAVQTGAKSVVATLWSVDDRGTLVLMTQFYQNLKNDTIKAQALQKAQVDMLKGTTRIEAGKIITTRGNIALPADVPFPDQSFTHPYYWAPFTLIGSPW